MTDVQDLGPAAVLDGKIFTFIRDLSATLPNHPDYRPGVHFIWLELSASGYCFTAWNTHTQRREVFMNESWLVALIRVIGPSATTENGEE